MAKEKAAPSGGVLQELFQFNVYKRSQGRVTRQVTFAAMAIIVALGVWRLYIYARENVGVELSWALVYLLPGLLLLAGLWLSFRAVNMVRFADFLIAVEAEMSKVSWPTRGELYRSALIVILVIVILAASLFVFDLIWAAFFRYLGVGP